MGRTDVVPCDVNHTDNRWQTCDHFPYVPTPVVAVTQPITPFSDVIASQPLYIHQYYKHIEFYPQAAFYQFERNLLLCKKTNHTLHIAANGGIIFVI